MRTAAGDKKEKCLPRRALPPTGCGAGPWVLRAVARKNLTAHAIRVRTRALVKEPPTFVIDGMNNTADVVGCYDC